MNKKTVRCIVLIVVSLLILSILGFGIYLYVKNKNDNTKNESGVIFQFSPGEIESIGIAKGNYSYTLEKDDGNWRLKDDEDKILVQESVEEAAAVFSSVSGTIIENPPNIVFGITVEIEKRLKKVIFQLASDKDGYYLKTKNGDVYLVSQVLYSVADRDEGYYRDKTVSPIKSFGPEGENRFVSYNYKFLNKNGEKREVNVRLKNEAEVLKYDTSSLYMLDSPYLLTVDAVDFESNVLTKIPLLSAERFIPIENTSLSLFGLDEAQRATLTVKYDDKAFILYVGATAEDIGEKYCMLPDSDEVFTIKSGDLNFLSYNGFYLANKSIFKFNIDYIRSVRVKSKDILIKLRFDGTNFYIGEVPVPKDTAEEFFDELEKIKASSIEFEPAGGSELMQITLTGSDGVLTEYKVIKTEDERFIVSENNKIFFRIEPGELKAFTDYITKLN